MTLITCCCLGVIFLTFVVSAPTPMPEATTYIADELLTTEGDVDSTTDEATTAPAWTERFIIFLHHDGRIPDEVGTEEPHEEKPIFICEWPAFLCYTGECVNGSGLCNGVLDCPMGEDEGPECGEKTTIIFALVSMSIGTIFALLFMYMYYLRIKMLEEDVFVTPGGDSVTDADRRYIRLVEIALRNTLEAERMESVEYVQYENCVNGGDVTNEEV